MPPQTGFSALLSKIIPAIEKGALAITVVGSVFRMLHFTGGANLLMIGLSALAGAWYLYAFAPVPRSDDQAPPRRDFFSLLVTTMLPKILGIAGSVNLFGILFYLLHMPGATEMLWVGSVSGGLATLILIVAVWSGKIATLPPLAWRAGIVAAIGLYYLSLPVAA